MTATKKDKYFVLGVMFVIFGIALSVILFDRSTVALVPIFFGMALALWAKGHLYEYGLTRDLAAKVLPVEGEFCAYCGKEHGAKNGAKFCQYCGKEL